MQLAEFNRLSEEAARSLVDPCLGVERWVAEIAAARPYDGLPALVAQASASAQQFSDDELTAALRRHPRIGEGPPDQHPNREAGFSRSEQSGVDPADADTADRIRQGNRGYEDRFGRVFLIRAAGLSSGEILAELERRLGNDDEAERREVVAQLREIALLRLDQVVTP